jgi:hypothetical protein
MTQAGGSWATPQRRAVGVQLLDGPQAQYAIVSALAADRGNLGRLLVKMQSEGALVRLGEDDDAQVRWALADGQGELVRAALAAEQPTGSLVAGQRIVLVAVPAQTHNQVASALRAARTTGMVVWASKTEGSDGQWLLVISAHAAPMESQRLIATLEHAGARCSRLIVEDVMSADAMRRGFAALRQAAR